MADLIGNPGIAAQVQPPQGMSLADMVNLAQGVQSYQQAQQVNPLLLEKTQLELQQAKTLNPIAAQKAQMEAQKQKSELNSYYGNETRRAYGGLLADPDFNPNKPNAMGMIEKLNEAKDYLVNVIGVPEHESKMHEKMIEHLHKHGDVGANRVLQMIKNGVQQSQTTTEQGAQLNKIPSFLNLGGQVQPVLTSPYQTSEAQLKKPMDVGLPPTTEVVNPTTGEKTLLGPQSQRPNQQIVSALSPSQAGALEAGKTTVVADWPKTLEESKDAKSKIALYQNIKKLVPESYTGVGAEKKQFVANLAQAIGMDYKVLESSSTDELMKNTRLLQLAGGNTDAARNLAELANPNTHMTKEGINRVVNQLQGIENMKLARANYLGRFANNGPAYQAEMQKFNEISDPRIFQEMSPTEVAKLKASMSKEEQAAMGKQIKMAREMGVIK